MRIALCLLCTLCLLGACRRRPPQIPSNRETIDTLKEDFLAYNRLCLEAERAEISAYIDSSEQSMQYDENGFWYAIVEKGKGKAIRKGQTVKYAYSIELLDGSVCYTTDQDGIKSIQVGKRQAEKGIDLALPLFSKQTEAVLILPSYLAYGLIGDRKCIPPHTPILYRIKIIDIQP